MKFIPSEEFESINRRFDSIRTGDCRLFGKVEAYTVKATSEDKKLKTFLQSKYEDDQTCPTANKADSREESTCTRTVYGSNTDTFVSRNPAQINGVRRGSLGYTTAIEIFPANTSRDADNIMGVSYSSNSSSYSKSHRLLNDSSLSMSSLSPKRNPSHRKTLLYLLSTLNNMFGPDYDFSDIGSHYFVHIPSSDVAVRQVQHDLENCLGDRVLGDLQMALWSAIDDVVGLNDSECWQFTPDSAIEPGGEDGSIMWSFYYFFYNRKLKRIVIFACRAVYLMSSSQEDDELDETYLVADDNGSDCLSENSLEISQPNFRRRFPSSPSISTTSSLH